MTAVSKWATDETDDFESLDGCGGGESGDLDIHRA
jgi:hypothetical protein